VKDAKGERGNISITIEEKTFEAPPQKIELTTIPLGNARANITTNGLYIAPDGRAVRLPAGAVPIQLRFTGTWGLPPTGTLQGFEWNGSTYFAEIKGYINQSFVGYRKVPLCPEVYLKDIYETTSGETDAFYFKKFKDANGCGIQKISVKYIFNPTGDQSLIKISPDITGDVIEKAYYTDQNACNPTNYVNKDGFKNNNTSLSADKAENLNKLTSTLNSKLGELLKVTLVAVNSADIEKMKIEAQEKGLQTLEVFEFEGVYLFAFGGGEIGTCEKDYITQKMKDVQGSDAYKTLGKWDKIIASTSTYYYNWFFAILKCRVAKEKYYTCTKDANNKETCTLKAGASEAEAFVAGFLHSVIEDLDFVEMAAGLITMAKQATTSVATQFLNYPQELYEVYKKAPNTWSGEDIYKIIPPVKPTKEGVDFVSNAVSFFWNNYITDANYWTSGELTAMVAPALITGGAYLAKKLPQITSKLAGRLASKVAGLDENLNIVALFKAGKKIDYDDIGDIEQVIVKNNDEIDGIYEKVGDELVPICGFTPAGGRVTSSRRCPKIRFTGEALQELATRLGSQYDEIVDILDKLTPRKSHTLIYNDVNKKLKLVDTDGVEWLEDITSTQVLAKSGNNPWNKFLNGFPPLKNFEYVVDGKFKFKTDDLGRVEKITIENLELNPNKERDRYQQGLTKGLKNGKDTDNGGHMVGNQFDGPSEQINYHSQDWVSNQSGDWFKMETELKQLRLNNPTATIKVEIVPEFNGTNKRPDKFNVRVSVFENGQPKIINKPTYEVDNP